MRTSRQRKKHVAVCALAGTLALLVGATQAEAAAKVSPKAKFTGNVAFRVSVPVRELSAATVPSTEPAGDETFSDFRREGEPRPVVVDSGFSGDGALRAPAAKGSALSTLAVGPPLANFEGLSNQDNANIFGFRVNPPDPMGDVGPNHYVEMTNLAYAVYDKAGTKLLGPVNIGDLWDGFAIADCADASGDPVVVYDQLADRWILSQFTTRGPLYYNCFAVSQTGDPTGAFYQYAFVTQTDAVGGFFPDYPKTGVWSDSYIMTTRDFGNAPTNGYGISVYALEKNKMIAGLSKARAVQFFLEYGGSIGEHLEWIGDGLLPPDVDGSRRPQAQISAPIVGTQDDDSNYGATFDAVNVFDLKVLWNVKPVASLTGPTQLPVASFDSIFPCGVVAGTAAPSARDCLPQPGVTNGSQFLDVLSYRQRPTYRLAYRNFGTYEAFVTNQAVEASAGMAGVRWYELRRTNGVYSVHQQGTYAPADGVHRWMGSAAMDWQGNMAIGYSVVDGTSVYPGIRYAGRLKADPAGDLSLGEGTIIDGTGIQRSTNSRWGDYSSLNVDPTDDCTFWYVNEYYTAAGEASSTAGWQTRIASFKLPGCVAKQ